MYDLSINELPHNKTKNMICVPSEDSNQPRHLPSLIRFFAVRMEKAWVLSYPLSHSEGSDQTGQIWVFSERTGILMVLSWGGSNITVKESVCKKQDLTRIRMYNRICQTSFGKKSRCKVLPASYSFFGGGGGGGLFFPQEFNTFINTEAWKVKRYSSFYFFIDTKIAFYCNFCCRKSRFCHYRNDPKFSDRQARAKSADPDQTASRGAVWSGSTLFVIPSASFRSLVVQILGWLQQICRMSKFLGFLW